MNSSTEPRVVYVVGAGLSAGLGFPTIGSLLPGLWPRLVAAKKSSALADVIRFHHPGFNPTLPDTFPDIEQLLSEMQANTQLFDSSRPATGNFTIDELDTRRRDLLLELAAWFHQIKKSALAKPPSWICSLATKMLAEKARIISFNWDLVLDELLFGKFLGRESYMLDRRRSAPCLVKPHGSLNWYELSDSRSLKQTKRFGLGGKGIHRVFGFRPFRAPISKRRDRQYMPLIIPPVYAKQFDSPIFKRLWQDSVSILSTASEVRFLGYSLPKADFHARFILRCGFYNQEHGELLSDGGRAQATGRAKVTIVDIASEGPYRIREAVGWECEIISGDIADWVSSWK